MGFRLTLAGLAVAYERQEVFQGPFPVQAYIINDSVYVDYGTNWDLQIRDTEGFEVCNLICKM